MRYSLHIHEKMIVYQFMSWYSLFWPTRNNISGYIFSLL